MPRLLYHATPLHYLPHILKDGAVYAQSVLAGRDGITPRRTAKRRDRMLGLADYVHLSLDSHTPLLAHKLAKGYPHALLAFDRAAVLALPATALLPYNTKAWYTRACYAPVTDRAEQERMLRRHEEHGRYPSLEVLVKYGLDLASLAEVLFLTSEEREAVASLLQTLGLMPSTPLRSDPARFPCHGPYQPTTLDLTTAYFAQCTQAGDLLPPPLIPFD